MGRVGKEECEGENGKRHREGREEQMKAERLKGRVGWWDEGREAG